MRTSTSSRDYRPDIDGLRAIAVLSVVLYHAQLGNLTGGFIGVDIFFVISGFLITRIIDAELREDRFSLTRFYERRARRILPALFSVAGTCFLVGAVLYLPEEFTALSKSLAAVVIFASNLWFWRATNDYFGATAEAAPLLHTWSLGVEEQFYAVIPLLLMALHGTRYAKAYAAMALLAALSFALSIYGVSQMPGAAFYLMPTRLWELGVGSLLALRPTPRVLTARRGLRELTGMAGLMLVLGPCYLYTSETPFPGAAALAPCLGAGAIIVSGSAGPTAVSALLSLRPMVFVGLISYSLYLWHWPVLALQSFVLGKATKHLSYDARAAAVAGAVAIAVLSWRFVERIFRDQDRLLWPVVLRSASAVGVSFLILSFIVIGSDGAPARIAADTRQVVADARRIRATNCEARFGGQWCPLNSTARAEPEFLAWGDSHAEALAPALARAAQLAQKTGAVAHLLGCGPLIGLDVVKSRVRDAMPECRSFNDQVLAELRTKPHLHVVLVGYWNDYATNPLHRFSIRNASRGPVRMDAGGFEQHFGSTVAALRATGRDVTIIAQVPQFAWHVPRTWMLTSILGLPLPDAPTITTYREDNASSLRAIERVAVQHGARLVSLVDVLCQPTCSFMRDNQLVYVDTHHLATPATERWLAPALASRIWGASP